MRAPGVSYARQDSLLAFITDHGVWVKTGCFWDTLNEFEAAVKRTHDINEHAQEYGIAIQLVKLHASLSGVK